MATLKIKERQPQKQNSVIEERQQHKQNSVKDKRTTTATSKIYITNQQPPHKHHYYYKNNSNQQQKQQHQQSNVIKRENDKDVSDDENFQDFYHIKLCYQPATITTKRTTKTRTLNQRKHYHSSTTTPTPPPPTSAAATLITATTITTAIRKSSTLFTTINSLSHALNSFSYNCRSFVTMLLFGYLLLIHYAMAAPQSCILCDKNDLLAKDPQTNYEEFLFEHQVTRQDAINALRQLNDSFYEGTSSDSSCNGVRCTEKVMKYCLGPQFINDHCWCEVGHSTEGLPFVPHICYVGEKIYKTSVGSCFFYEEVKDCCCSSVLAKEWRHISAGSSIFSKSRFHVCNVLAVITLLYLLIRRLYN